MSKNLRTLPAQYIKRYLCEKKPVELSKLDYKQFPSTRYQGSKRKIIPWLHNVFSELEFNSALDACGGTGVVSYLFKKMGKNVTYNDVLKFNHIIGKAIIQNSKIKFLKEDLDLLLNIEPSPQFNFIQKTFNDIYYPRSENKWLDKTMNGIINMNHYHDPTLDYKKSLALYALFQACLTKRPFNLFHRKNLNLRTNDVKRNFGNKTTWEKSFKDHFTYFISEVNDLVFDSHVKCRATNESIFDLKETNFDLVYIDSPYFGKNGANETSNYLKCYHFLEGLAEYETWSNKIDYETLNLRYKAAKTNQFNSSNLFNTFDTIFDKFSGSKIVLSYKNGGVPSIQTLVKALKRHKKKVYYKSHQYSYALNRNNSDNRFNKEVLIIGL